MSEYNYGKDVNLMHLNIERNEQPDLIISQEVADKIHANPEKYLNFGSMKYTGETMRTEILKTDEEQKAHYRACHHYRKFPNNTEGKQRATDYILSMTPNVIGDISHKLCPVIHRGFYVASIMDIDIPEGTLSIKGSWFVLDEEIWVDTKIPRYVANSVKNPTHHLLKVFRVKEDYLRSNS